MARVSVRGSEKTGRVLQKIRARFFVLVQGELLGHTIVEDTSKVQYKRDVKLAVYKTSSTSDTKTK